MNQTYRAELVSLYHLARRQARHKRRSHSYGRRAFTAAAARPALYDGSGSTFLI
jgi:hypothetical protein